MTLQQLLEHAHLDALGLLDPADQAGFEKAFAGAPPALKAVIREEQARWAESFLPDAEPSPELREKVLAAVSAAMLEAGRFSDHEVGELHGARRVPSWWRAAAVAASCVCLLLAGAAYSVFTGNQRLADRITDDKAREFWVTLGGEQMVDSLFDPRKRTVYFEPVLAGFEGQASVFTHPEWDKTRFFCNALPAVKGEAYRVVVLGPANQVGEPLQEFESNSLVQTFQFKALAAGTRLGLVRVAGDTQTLLMVATV